jgi:hypothetical protein
MTGEVDPEHLVGFALVPVGAGVDVDQRSEGGLVVVEPGGEGDPPALGDVETVVRSRSAPRPLPFRGSPTATSLAQSMAERNENNTRSSSSRATVSACTQSVGRDTLTLMVSKVISACRPRRRPPLRRSPQRVVGLGRLLLDLFGLVGRFSVSGGLEVTLVPLLLMSSPWIFCWRRTIPSSRASGRGGQPGT